MLYGNAVLHERDRHGRLQEADVAGPEREDDRHVHQHEHEPGSREGEVEVERLHHRPDREELHEPADELAHRRTERRHRPPQDGEPLARHDQERPQAPHPVVHAAAAGAGEEEADHQQDEADEPEDDQARHGPVRDLRRQQHPGDEERDREEVEQAMGEDGAEQGRARAPAVRQMPAQHRDARELAGPRRQHRVPEQADPEGGEHLTEARVWLGQGLVDRQPPRQRAREDGERG